MNHQWITTSNGLLIVATEVSTFALSIQGPSFLHRNKMDRRCWSAQSSGGGANGWSRLDGWWKKRGDQQKCHEMFRILEVWKFGLWKFRSISLRLHNFFTLVEKKSSESDHRCHSVSQVSTEKSAVEVRLVWTSAMTGRMDSFDTPKIGCVLLWRISLTRRTMMCFTSFKPLEWKTMVVSYRLGRSLFDWGVTSSRSRKDGQRESLNERHGQALQAHGRWPLANF